MSSFKFSPGAMPPRTSSAGSSSALRSTPLGRMRNETEQPSASTPRPSQDSRGDFDPIGGISRPGHGREAKMVEALVDRIVKLLPCTSGNRMRLLALNAAMQSSTEALKRISTQRLPIVLHALLGALEGLAKYSVADVITEVALEVVQSQLVLLQILDTCLTQSWRRHAEAAADYRPEGHHQSWVDPLPLDEGLARRILSVVISYLRLASSESSIRSGTTISATNRDGRGQVDTVNPWGYGQISQPTTSTFSPDFVRTHVHSRQRHENRRHQNSFGVHVSTIVDAVPELTRYLGQIVYYLSSSNWSLVFGRVRSRLLHLTTTIEDMPDLIDLRLLQWSNMNRARLGQVLQEGSTRFLNIKRPAQIAFATVLHAVIWNWLEINPNEFENLVTTDGRLEGNPDGLFDVLYSMSDFSSSNAKRTAVFYPLLSMLLVICPDMLKKVVLGETKSKSSGVSKKSSFMESLKKGLNSGNKGTEPSTRCYVNFVKAAVVLSPQNEGAGLRILLSEIVNDLKNSLFFGPHSNDFVETSLPVDGLVALYRANPSVTSSTIFSRLWIDSDISRNIAVKACAIIAREHQALPWQPSIDSLRNESAPQIRQAFKGAVNLHTAEREPHHPRTSLDNSPVLADIIQQTLELYKTHPEFAFTPGPGGTEIRAEDVDSFFLTISALFVRPERSDIRLLAGSILEVTLEYLVSADVRRARPAVITPYAWQSLLNASAQILLAFHAGDSEELVAASQTYREVSLMFAHYITSLDDTFFDNSACDNACTVAAVAGLIAFTGADPEQYLLVLPAMSALNEIARKRNLSQSGDEATKANARLLEEIAGLRPVRGRQQQQKQLRGVIRANRDSSTMLPIVWIGLRHRLDDLMAKMGRSSSKTETGSPAHAVGAPGLTDDEAKEWQNLNAFLTGTATAQADSYPVRPLADHTGPNLLPAVYGRQWDWAAASTRFIEDRVPLLSGGFILVRESVKEALGNDLSLTHADLLERTIRRTLSEAVGPSGITVSESSTLLVDQSIAVLRMVVERMPPGKVNVFLDLQGLIPLFARYLGRLERNETTLRTKLRFCHLVEMAFDDQPAGAVDRDGVLRNLLLESLIEWSAGFIKDHEGHPGDQAEKNKSQKDLDHACLRTLAVLTRSLVLRPTAGANGDTLHVVRTRLFQRYLSQLTKIIESPIVLDDTLARLRTTTAESRINVSTTELPASLAIKTISQLLSANMDVGLQLCLPLGYHGDPALRSAFVQLTAGVLRNGSPFGGVGSETVQSRHPTPYVDALVNDNMAFAVAICEVGPPSQVDEMLKVLFANFEARGTLLGLMKVMIEKEVAQTNHESELFRANTITTKMLTVFGRIYGSNYLRMTLEPLIHNLNEKPLSCSFELDPSKVGPNEKIEDNADRLQHVCQALLDMICQSTSRMPIMFRALCHQIWEIVQDRFPEACHSAVGSFIFLRFFCPAIVNPEAVELDVSADAREIRRALLMITKVIQNLANNVKFKEPHMQILNDFLAANIKQVTRYLGDIATRPRSWELAAVIKTWADEADSAQTKDMGNDVLHRFVFKHYGQLQPVLEKMPPSYRRSSTPRSARADIDGEAALKQLLELMRTTGEPFDVGPVSPSARTQAYREFMHEQSGRGMDMVKDVFFEGPASQNGRRIFYFLFDPSKLVDHDLLAYHIFSSLEDISETFDLVFDLTQYNPSVDFPKSWLQCIAQMCPPSLLQKIHVIALYNVSTFAQKRMQTIVRDLLPICGPVGKDLVSVCSPSELGESIPFTTLHFSDYTMNLAYNADTVFTNLYLVAGHGSQCPIIAKLGVDCLQIATKKQQPLFSNHKGYIVDVIRLADIDDVVVSATDDHLTVRHQHNQSIVLVSQKRHELAQMIRAAKSRLRDTLSEERALRPNDVPGTLLNLALLNLTAEDEALRSSAYNLVHDLSTFFDWNLLSGGPKVSTRDMAIPSNSITYVCALSKSLAASAPHLTLDFLKEWTIGFVRADVPQKTACLQYVVPWIANLGAFAMPTHGDYAGSKKQVEEIIKNLISITTAEQGRLHVVIQQHIWRNIAKSDMYLLDIVVSLLVDTAIDSGVESERTECVAEIFHEISSIAIRGKLVARLRKTIAQTYLKPSITLWQNPAWIEICALTRINMLLSFQPSDSLGTRLYLPELIHIITLLVGSGSVIMRTMLYKLSVNMLQSLASSRATEDMDGTFLRQALERAQSEEVTRCFGLVKVGNVLEGFDDGPSEHGEVNAALLDRVEHIAGFLGDVLAAAAPSTDCLNAWRCRWMSLVVGTCFQHNPATQPQAIIVLGYLASDEVDDDLVYQILVSMSTSLSHLSHSDITLLASMMRCLSSVTPGLMRDSRYATSLFWLAFAMTELGSVPLFGPACQLMQTSLSALADDPRVDHVMDHLLEYRRIMGEPAAKIDQIAGVSFDSEPSYSIMAVLGKGFRHPSTRISAIDITTTLLKITTEGTAADDDSVLIPRASVPYFIALLPVVAGDQAMLKTMFTAAGLEVMPEKAVDVENMALFELLSVPDNSSAVLLIALVVTSLNSASTDTERLVLYRLLAAASEEMPEVLNMAYDALLPQIQTTICTSSHPQLIQCATTMLERAMADPNYTFPTEDTMAGESQRSLHHVYQPSISSANGFGSRGPMVGVLDDLKMKGLTENGFGPVKMDRLCMTAKWVAALIDSFTL